MAIFIVLLGPPGVGKGTQAKILAKAKNLAHISSGDLFRENIKNQTELGKHAKLFIDKGELVPDDVTIDMIRERLSRPDCIPGAILDGFPPKADGICDIDGSELYQREDDKVETVTIRIRVYLEQTIPLVEYYRKSGKLVEINGAQAVEKVSKDLCVAVNK